MTETSAPRDQASTILRNRQPSEPKGLAVIVLKAGVGPRAQRPCRQPRVRRGWRPPCRTASLEDPFQPLAGRAWL